jgi:Ca2+-binding EF-hand superfamily protein
MKMLSPAQPSALDRLTPGISRPPSRGGGSDVAAPPSNSAAARSNRAMTPPVPADTWVPGVAHRGPATGVIPSSIQKRMGTKNNDNVYPLWQAMAKHMEKKGSSTMDAREFTEALQSCYGPLPMHDVMDFFETVDTNGSGRINYRQFADSIQIAMPSGWFDPRHNHPIKQSPALKDMKPDLHKIEQMLQDKMVARSAGGSKEVRNIWASFDADKSGHITPDEFDTVLKSFNMHLDRPTLMQLIKRYDQDFDGRLNYNEFSRKLFPQSFSHEESYAERLATAQAEREVELTDKYVFMFPPQPSASD